VVSQSVFGHFRGSFRRHMLVEAPHGTENSLIRNVISERIQGGQPSTAHSFQKLGLSQVWVRFLLAIFGLALAFGAALAASCVFLACLVFWNAGLMFQWGTHLVPARGPISFPQMIQNQFLVVPRQIMKQSQEYLLGRKAMMQQIEQRDLEQLKKTPPPP